MFLRIEIAASKKLIGKRMTMSFAENKTAALWRSFMPQRNNISNAVSNTLFSAEVYPSHFFSSFNVVNKFEKWAAVEVSNFDTLPEAMETLFSPAGWYAVFLHRGPASEGPRTYGYIFNSWLPASAYTVDHRPHFALMGEKYQPESPDSEEEIWIPIRPKADVKT